MNVLAFDTCFSACSVAAAVIQPGQPARVARDRRLMATGHAEALMPMIATVMREAGLGFGALDRIVVTHGPGTFTGVRTGIAAARALALATGAMIVGVSSLWAIAYGAIERGEVPAGADAVLAVMDARKGQVYAEAIDSNGTTLHGPRLLDADDAARLLPDRRLFIVGTSAEVVTRSARRLSRELNLGNSDSTATSDDQPDAFHLLGAASRSSIATSLQPLYLRAPDAKPQSDKSLPWSST